MKFRDNDFSEVHLLIKIIVIFNNIKCIEKNRDFAYLYGIEGIQHQYKSVNLFRKSEITAFFLYLSMSSTYVLCRNVTGHKFIYKIFSEILK